MEQVARIMQEGVEEGVFPGAVLLASKGGKIVFHQAFGYTDRTHRFSATTKTIYDLASLTKPLATAACIMALVEQGRISIKDRLGALHPGFSNPEKKTLTLEQLLSHTSGFPAYRPYYEVLSQYPFEARQARLLALLNSEPLEYAPGKDCIYSDLGYMAISLMLEEYTGAPLDQLFFQLVAEPLGIGDLYFRPFNPDKKDASPVIASDSIAPTEDCPWRKKVIHGQVHDDNAWTLGGAAGHAGLFGTAHGVWRLVHGMRGAFAGEAGRFFASQNTMKVFLENKRAPGAYVLGFDTPTPSESSSGKAFSPGTVGHLGFTGTSFWADLSEDAVVALLSNRVHPTRNNGKIRIFRPKIHNAVMEAMGFFPE
ncbi:CubicO group peptidase, beta-lactamase class C family [Desulfatibacillum alkenivorans DSM 16219]|jgi:CubicO group peptidase (beta-lactamase class C family)|uniref:CubicO group peptidase, beta-lactamase class C family n=1 Tax=Desulfatibacillum alkenivorans DSM 16219 TaxID=1121393 RepID=A0A1M6FJV0_9BACT|nr:serine hydrolase domain-containing protein [Desulfatibacillum alkenivorans]SHI97902.1 CubicO group peptidase, beta-lactamase class C family [Desulfatibacillum alkenivorans DSM 16219]